MGIGTVSVPTINITIITTINKETAMHDSLGWQRGSKQAASARARQTPVEFHEGSRREFLRRHERATRNTATGTSSQRREFARCLLSRTADERNLMCAIDHLVRSGDKAPGPNGVKLELLEPHEHWHLARTLRDMIRNGSYRPGPTRRVDIPKTSGTGTRPLDIHNTEDKIVQRAIAQTVQPLLDPIFDERSFGYRPGLAREHALANARLLADQAGSWVWITEDLQDAFSHVPHGRLLDALRRQGLPDDLLDLISRVIHNRQGRGLSQGSCLSPLLLNAYLHHHLDRRWRRSHSDIPLIRAADDLLVICRNPQQAQEAYGDLDRLLRPTGMSLKHGPQKAIRRLDAGEQAEWLGFQLSHEGREYRDDCQNGTMQVRLGRKSWNRLTEKFCLLHETPQAPLRANEALLGWMDQLGPCFRGESQDEVRVRILSIAQEAAFEEIPPWDGLRGRWELAYARYRATERVARLRASISCAGGSAQRHRDSASHLAGRGEGTASAAPPPFSSSLAERVTLYVAGYCGSGSRLGGYAFQLDGPTDQTEFRHAESAQRATHIRLELAALCRGLSVLESPTSVTVVTDSPELHRSLTEGLAQWRSNNWRRSRNRPLANEQLWRKAEQLLEQHDVHFVLNRQIT